MMSREKPEASADAPGGILDLWEPTAVYELTEKHAVCVLGVELKVSSCRPAERGGDFYVLEAIRDDDPRSGGEAWGRVAIEVDRNRLVHARLADDGARYR